MGAAGRSKNHFTSCDMVFPAGDRLRHLDRTKACDVLMPDLVLRPSAGNLWQ
jgi:hypothetical protein